MSRLATVVASDVGLILSRRALLSGVDVYSASIRTIRGATVRRTLSLVVRLVGVGWAAPAFALLLTRVLPIVDPNGYSDVRV